jgi:hypothetical protein
VALFHNVISYERRLGVHTCPRVSGSHHKTVKGSKEVMIARGHGHGHGQPD